MKLLDLLMLPVFILKWIWNGIRGFGSSNWPIIQGTINSSRAVVQRQGSDEEWVAEFAYCYTVEGEYYAGYYIRSAYIHDEAAAWRVAEGWEGRPVMVRYHPQRHDMARVRPADQLEGRIGNLP